LAELPVSFTVLGLTIGHNEMNHVNLLDPFQQNWTATLIYYYLASSLAVALLATLITVIPLRRRTAAIASGGLSPKVRAMQGQFRFAVAVHSFYTLELCTLLFLSHGPTGFISTICSLLEGATGISARVLVFALFVTAATRTF
jgi:hypothetical protein